VFAYDMADERRARRVRKLLQSVHHAAQYSVFEALLGEAEFRGLLAELTALCDLNEDLLAVWWPRHGQRLEWRRESIRMRSSGKEETSDPDIAKAARGAGNYLFCYDVSDEEALLEVAAQVAPEGAMVQRSVYWLRTSAKRLLGVLKRCGSHVAESDRLWVYPLQRAGDLWRVSAGRSAVLPISAHFWPPERE
jgi:CRISPR/Cas system-associated endoribonuclease Cas2